MGIVLGEQGTRIGDVEVWVVVDVNVAVGVEDSKTTKGGKGMFVDGE